jgi:hypothetical protein
VVPHLPIPNRIVKRLCADDSGRTSVKVGHRQALIPQNPRKPSACGGFVLCLANAQANGTPWWHVGLISSEIPTQFLLCALEYG